MRKQQVKIDAISNAKLVHRYLAKVGFTKLLEDGKPLFTKNSYEIQWDNIRHDLKNAWRPSFWVPKVAYAIATAVLALTNNKDAAFSIAFVGAVARDTDTGGGNVATTVTWSHTNTGGDFIAIGAVVEHSGTTSSVSYNSVALSVKGTADNDSGSSARVSIWGLVAPATGSNTASVTNTTGYQASGYAITYSGVDQTSPTSSVQTATGNSSTPSLSVSSSANSIVMDLCGWDNAANNSPTVGAGQTEVAAFGVGGPHSHGSYESGAASVTMSWTLSTTTQWAHVALSVDAPTNISDSETITVTESVGATVVDNVSPNDSVTITDEPTVFVSPVEENPIACIENITLTESVSVFLPIIAVNVSETITVTENLSTLIVFGIEVSDAITITESTNALNQLNPLISVSESISVQDVKVIGTSINWTNNADTSTTWRPVARPIK